MDETAGTPSGAAGGSYFQKIQPAAEKTPLRTDVPVFPEAGAAPPPSRTIPCHPPQYRFRRLAARNRDLFQGKAGTGRPADLRDDGDGRKMAWKNQETEYNVTSNRPKRRLRRLAARNLSPGRGWRGRTRDRHRRRRKRSAESSDDATCFRSRIPRIRRVSPSFGLARKAAVKNHLPKKAFPHAAPKTAPAVRHGRHAPQPGTEDCRRRILPLPPFRKKRHPGKTAPETLRRPNVTDRSPPAPDGAPKPHAVSESRQKARRRSVTASAYRPPFSSRKTPPRRNPKYRTASSRAQSVPAPRSGRLP